MHNFVALVSRAGPRFRGNPRGDSLGGFTPAHEISFGAAGKHVPQSRSTRERGDTSAIGGSAVALVRADRGIKGSEGTDTGLRSRLAAA